MIHKHFLLYKPDGYLSQFKLERKKKYKLLGDLYKFPEGTMAIGRLDKDSEGLLLLTTDGKMSEYVRSSKIDKEYQFPVCTSSGVFYLSPYRYLSPIYGDVD